MRQEKLYPLYLLLLTVVLYFTALGTRDFWAPVEPRYAEIARVMFAKGEWIVPTVNGDLYTDKPILYFWLVLVASKAFGLVNEWTVRLPVALSGVGLVIAVYCVGRDFFNPRIGFLAATMLATSARVVWEARWAHIDVLFCLLFVLSVYYFARVFLGKGRPNEISLAYGFMALATLAKGLIGFVLPALLLAAFMITRRDWRMIAAARLHLGILIFLIVTAPWVFLVSSATDGKWLADFIYVHHIQRYTAGAGHRQPIYYYFTTLPVDFLPWTLLAVPALGAYRRYREYFADPVKLFFVLWFLVVFLFFSASDTKRDLYLMPLMPPVAIFLAHYMNDLAAGVLRESALYRVVSLAFFSLVGLAGLCLPAVAWLLRRDAFAISLPAGAILLGGGAWTAFLVWRREPLKVVGATVLMMALNLIYASLWVFPYVEPYKSRRPFAERVQRIVPSGATLYVYADTMNDFNYYTGRERIPVIGARRDLGALLARESKDYLLIKQRDLDRTGVIPREKIVASDNVGSSTWHLVSLSAGANP